LMIVLGFLAYAVMCIFLSLLIHGVRFLFSKSFDWDRVMKTAFVISVTFIIFQVLHVGLEYMRHR
jgi:hypothetical protein